MRPQRPNSTCALIHSHLVFSRLLNSSEIIIHSQIEKLLCVRLFMYISRLYLTLTHICRMNAGRENKMWNRYPADGNARLHNNWTGTDLIGDLLSNEVDGISESYFRENLQIIGLDLATRSDFYHVSPVCRLLPDTLSHSRIQALFNDARMDGISESAPRRFSPV